MFPGFSAEKFAMHIIHQIEELYYKLNYHDQKIQQALHATYRTTEQLFLISNV